MIRTFTVGEYAEEMPWEIIEDFVVDRVESVVCSHAHRRTDGTYLIPRIIRAYNEAGFNQTQVCVDCILEGLK